MSLGGVPPSKAKPAADFDLFAPHTEKKLENKQNNLINFENNENKDVRGNKNINFEDFVTGVQAQGSQNQYNKNMFATMGGGSGYHPMHQHFSTGNHPKNAACHQPQNNKGMLHYDSSYLTK
jgi:hypothetical protein